MSKKLKDIKNYWNKRPCNINHSNEPGFTRKYFNAVRKKKYFVENHILKFADFKKYKKKNVLEIGCGIGTDAMEFIKNGANYVGIDYSDESLKIAKKRVETLKLSKKNPKFVMDNCEELKIIKKLKRKFHLIYSFGVLHHTENMQKAFDRIHEISDQNTEIKIMLYAKNSYKKFLLNESDYRYEAQKGCPVVYTVDDRDVDNLIKNKFTIIKKYQDFIFPYKITPYKKNKYIKIAHFNVMPKKIFNLLQKNIGEHMMLVLKKI